MGRCPSCMQWDSLDEFKERKYDGGFGLPRGDSPSQAVPIASVAVGDDTRIETGEPELDRVLGGGITAGSIILVAGDPGIGKSTLLSALPRLLPNEKILYVCGEESAVQVAARGQRLGLGETGLLLFEDTDVAAIDDVVKKEKPTILIVDSIQTVTSASGSVGSVKQLRESTSYLQHLAKQTNTATFLIGHVTKSGDVAGPRVLEHIVDTVLYLEGERHGSFRILRAVKNRFGSTNEIGVFTMRPDGLRPVANPSELFLSERSTESPGSTVVCTLEGTRPILVEIQALVSRSTYGQPQRNATGFDPRRLQMLIAVLAKRAGADLSDHDVFVNVVGGIRLTEPACDLGVAIALVSSLLDKPTRKDVAWVGEIGLGGEIRSVSRFEKRLAEVKKLGFERIIGVSNAIDVSDAISIASATSIQAAIEKSF